MLKFCKITCIVRDELAPPFFIGSKLRGAFGWALKGYESELFDEFFASQNATHRYRFDFALGAKSYDFSLYIFDKATANAPIICIILHKMLAKIGLENHAQRVIFRDFSLFLNDNLIFENKDFKGVNFSGENGVNFAKNSHNFGENFKNNDFKNSFDFTAFNGDFAINLNPKHFEREFKLKNSPQRAILRLLTPLRIKKNNAFVRHISPNNFDFNDILGSIFRRYNELLGCERAKTPHFKGEIIHANTEFTELIRKSSRQRAMMSLGGLVGELEISALDAQSYAFLRLGEFIGVGKSCVFGLGKIKLEPLS